MDGLEFSTRILHSDRLSRPEHGSLHKPIHPSIAFGYEKAKDLVDVFQGKTKGYAYGRPSNPTVASLEEKITIMEEGKATVCTATGMAAIGTLVFSLLKAGDHLISSAFLFGSTISLMNSFKRIGIDVSFVDPTEVKNVTQAIKSTTKLVFLETIANPMTQVADLKKIGDLCIEKGIIYVVDNTLTPPYSFRPVDVGGTFSIHSLSKYIGGHGNALGGSITDLGNYDWRNHPNIIDLYKKLPTDQWAMTQIEKKGLRDVGAILSPEAAHKISVGSDTLALRYEKASKNTIRLAEFLERHPRIKRVHYPGLDSHPQHSMATSFFKTCGAVFSFELTEDMDCLKVMDKMQIAIISTNLGDNRTLILPVAKTIFHEVGPEKRKEMGIDESLIRVSVGIEESKDLLADFSRAIEAGSR